MTDAELIELLRRMSPRLDILDCENILAAADRIEALVKEKDQEYKDNIVRMAGQAKDFMEEISTLKARIEVLIAERDAAEAKLAKAVGLLEEIEVRLRPISGFFFDTFPRKEIKATLAELKGVM